MRQIIICYTKYKRFYRRGRELEENGNTQIISTKYKVNLRYEYEYAIGYDTNILFKKKNDVNPNFYN